MQNAMYDCIPNTNMNTDSKTHYRVLLCTAISHSRRTRNKLAISVQRMTSMEAQSKLFYCPSASAVSHPTAPLELPIGEAR
eukprot:3872321-Amphidinium_carterae.1